MEKRGPLKEVGNNTPEKNEPQEQKISDTSLDKENEFFTPSEGTDEPHKAVIPEKEKLSSMSPEKAAGDTAEIGLDIEYSPKPKLRLSFLKSFDPLYKESPDKFSQRRPQLVIEDSDTSLSPQLSPLPADEETTFLDAVAEPSDEASDRTIVGHSHVKLDEQSLIKFYTPEKEGAAVLEPSESISTYQVVHSESVLPNVIEPQPTSETVHHHIEKRKLHGSNRLQQNTHSPHSPVVVPCKKQRITGSELAAAIRSKLQFDANRERGNQADIGEATDSNSEIGDIKTDSPDKSQGEKSSDSSEGTFKEVYLGHQSEDSNSYSELPETSNEYLKGLDDNSTTPAHEPSEKETADKVDTSSCETCPDLPESSKEPLVVREKVNVALKTDYQAITDSEIYPELPDTSEESAAADKTFEVLRKTPSPNIKLGSNVVLDPELSDRYVDEVTEKTAKKEDDEGVITQKVVESPKSVEKESPDEKISLTTTKLDIVLSEDTVKKEDTLTKEKPKSAEKVSDEIVEFNNLSTKKTVVQIEEKAKKDSSTIIIQGELKSVEDLDDQKPDEKVVEICSLPGETENLNPKIDSGEGSDIESTKTVTDALEYPEKEPEQKVSDEKEVKLESDGQVILDETRDQVSEESVQNEEVELLNKSTGKVEPEKGDTQDLETLAKGDNYSIGVYIAPLKTKMADLSEKLSEQQQENSDLKLQLNASQQAKASLELEIRQKEEIIIKTQAEALKSEQVYKHEIKQLREKLKEHSKLIEKDGSRELEEQLKEAKAREIKAITELNQRTKDDLNYQKIMEEYEKTIATRFADYQKLKEEHETATRHLANIELAFSDVHQKYERSKSVLEGYRTNEEALVAGLQDLEKTCKQHEERYESLKAHAQAQIEKSNKEILMLRDKYEMDINKLKAIIKRLEIKCGSLEVSLQQKTEECAALSALCDEVTGKRM